MKVPSRHGCACTVERQYLLRDARADSATPARLWRSGVLRDRRDRGSHDLVHVEDRPRHVIRLAPIHSRSMLCLVSAGIVSWRGVGRYGAVLIARWLAQGSTKDSNPRRETRRASRANGRRGRGV